MIDSITEQGGGRLSPKELLTRLSAGGIIPRRADSAEQRAAVLKRAAANLSPSELAATREAIRDDMRKRGISPQVRDAADRAVFAPDGGLAEPAATGE